MDQASLTCWNPSVPVQQLEKQAKPPACLSSRFSLAVRPNAQGKIAFGWAESDSHGPAMGAAHNSSERLGKQSKAARKSPPVIFSGVAHHWMPWEKLTATTPKSTMPATMRSSRLRLNLAARGPLVNSARAAPGFFRRISMQAAMPVPDKTGASGVLGLMGSGSGLAGAGGKGGRTGGSFMAMLCLVWLADPEMPDGWLVATGKGF